MPVVGQNGSRLAINLQQKGYCRLLQLLMNGLLVISCETCRDLESWHVSLQVMLFQPIALDEQAKDLLRAGQYEQALNLASVCAAEGAPWAETAFAQTALLFLHGALNLLTLYAWLTHLVLSLFACYARTLLLPAVVSPRTQ